MTPAERERFVDALRSMAAGRGDGIDLNSQTRWVVKQIRDPSAFLRAMGNLLSPDAIIYFEGVAIASDVAKFYEAHRAQNPVPVVRDTIYPVPESFHVTYLPEVVVGLCNFASSRPVTDLFDHIKAYEGESLVFTFHDAFTGNLFISDHVEESAVAAFCKSLGVSYERETNINKRDPEQLRRILWMFENPDKVRIAGEPWWRRLRRRWKLWSGS